MQDARLAPGRVRHQVQLVARRRCFAPLALQGIRLIIIEPATAVVSATGVVFAQREFSSVEGKAGRAAEPATTAMTSSFLSDRAPTGQGGPHPARAVCR